jgi:hypothetical protein
MIKIVTFCIISLSINVILQAHHVKVKQACKIMYTLLYTDLPVQKEIILQRSCMSDTLNVNLKGDCVIIEENETNDPVAYS